MSALAARGALVRADADRGAENGWVRPLTAFLFVLAAGIIRFSALERQALWNDEMFSFDVANLPLVEIQSRLLAAYHHPPLFFYALHGCLAWFGQSAWALRLVPALAGTLTVGAVYLIADRLFGRKAGLLAAALCLAAPFHVAYSQEGRPYALAALFCLLSIHALLMVLRQGRACWRLSYVAWTAALLYTHHWGVFVVLSQGVAVLADRGIAPKTRKGVVGLCYLPEAFALLSGPHASGSPLAEWVVPAGPMELVRLAGAFSGGSFQMASAAFALPWPLQALAGCAFLALLVGLSRRAFGSSGEGDLCALLVCAGVTVIVPFAVSFWIPKLFLWYRYPVIVFPILCVCAGSLVRGRGRERFLAIPVVVLVAVGLIGTAAYFSWSKSNVRDVAECVEEATKEDVRMIIRPRSFAFLLNYYYHGTAVELDETYLDQPLGEIVDTAASFVYVSLDIPSEIRSYMDGHFDKVAERTFPGEAHMGMVVGVYRQKPELDDEEEEPPPPRRPERKGAKGAVLR